MRMYGFRGVLGLNLRPMCFVKFCGFVRYLLWVERLPVIQDFPFVS